MPIYLVVAEMMHNPTGWSVWKILEVFETTHPAAIEAHQHDADINKWLLSGHNINTFMFEREPSNPFREWKVLTSEDK